MQFRKLQLGTLFVPSFKNCSWINFSLGQSSVWLGRMKWFTCWLGLTVTGVHCWWYISDYSSFGLVGWCWCQTHYNNVGNHIWRILFYGQNSCLQMYFWCTGVIKEYFSPSTVIVMWTGCLSYANIRYNYRWRRWNNKW